MLSSFSFPKSVKNSTFNDPNVYPQYSADGTFKMNPWAKMTDPRKANDTISLQKLYGGAINTYQPSIIRPFDTTMLPRDITRGTFETECKYPVYTGSKFQQWCSEDDAINYFAMRPIINPNDYNAILKKLFESVVMRSFGIFNINISKPDIRNDLWQSVFCDTTKKDVMNFIMLKIAEAVAVIPEMHKNGSWKVEQFHYTDAELYQLAYDDKLFYKVLFNLYNPLRSVSTQVESTVLINNQKPIIIQLGFVSTETDEGSVPGYNVGIAGKNSQINIDTPVEQIIPTDVTWNYGNTLLDQQFNKYGYYDPGYNVSIEGGIPDSLRKQINNFENTSNEYLFKPGNVKLNPEGVPVMVNALYDPIYHIKNPTSIEKVSYVKF